MMRLDKSFSGQGCPKLFGKLKPVKDDRVLGDLCLLTLVICASSQVRCGKCWSRYYKQA